MESNYEDEYDAVASALVATIFALTWYRRRRRISFFELCDMLKDKELLYNTLHMSVEEQTATFLYIIGHNVKNRVIGINFLCFGQILSLYFDHILYAIRELQGELILPPNTTTSPSVTQDPRFMPYFKICGQGIIITRLLIKSYMIIIIILLMIQGLH